MLFANNVFIGDRNMGQCNELKLVRKIQVKIFHSLSEQPEQLNVKTER